MWLISIDILFVLVFLWGVGLVAAEKYGYAIFTLLGLAVGSWLLFAPVKAFVAVGWKVLLFKWLPIYLAAGVVVALLKWFFHVWKTASKIKDAKESFKDNPKADAPNPADRRQAFVKHYMGLRNTYRSPDYVDVDNVADKRWKEDSIVAELLTPRAKKHVDRITFWVLEWPYVIIATIFDDILLKFARNVARFFDWAFTAASRFWISRVVKGI